jgi:hypothetical protein
MVQVAKERLANQLLLPHTFSLKTRVQSEETKNLETMTWTFRHPVCAAEDDRAVASQRRERAPSMGERITHMLPA